jgi:hypothetical protein
MKATNIAVDSPNKICGTWFVRAQVGKIPYQKRFENKPSDSQRDSAAMEFENNYAQLNDSEKEPVIVKPHHNEEL